VERMPTYGEIYLQWKEIRKRLRHAREWKDEQRYRELKEQERKLIVQLNSAVQ